MKNQVLSIEQMRKLKELGIDDSKASMAFVLLPREKEFLKSPVPNDQSIFECMLSVGYLPTFTLQDILGMLPSEIDGGNLFLNRICNSWSIGYCGREIYIEISRGCGLEATYDLIVWVAENGYLKGGSNA